MLKANAYIPPLGQTIVKVVDCGALPNASSKDVPHGLTLEERKRIVRIWGIAHLADYSSIWPLPFVQLPEGIPNSVSVSMTASYVMLRTGLDRSMFMAKIYIEYLV